MTKTWQTQNRNVANGFASLVDHSFFITVLFVVVYEKKGLCFRTLFKTRAHAWLAELEDPVLEMI